MTTEEGGSQAIATLRLKVQDRKVSEAEWVIARKHAEHARAEPLANAT